jgi:hypothetical protein
MHHGMPIMFGKVLGEPIKMSLAMHPTLRARAKPFHDIKVWGVKKFLFSIHV